MASITTTPFMRKSLLVGAYVALVTTAFLARVGGINPTSFWFDDVWMASLMKTANVGEMLQLQAHVPWGFLLLSRLMTGLVPDQEMALQLIPFLMGLAGIGLMAWVVYETTKSHAMALIGAALAAVSPLVAQYSINAKPFTMGFALTCLILVAAVRASREPSSRSMLWLVMAGLAGFLFSYGTIIVSIATISVSWLFALPLYRRRRPAFLALSAVVAAFVIILAGWVICDVHAHLNPSLRGFWEKRYIPLSSFPAAWAFMMDKGWVWISGALPENMSAFAILMIPGLVWLLCRRSSRLIGVAVLLYLFGVILASSLRFYPVGGKRTDIYSFPVIILLISCGVHGILSVVPKARSVAGSVAGAVVLAACIFPAQAAYDARVDAKRWVCKMQDLIRDEDGMVLHPYANWLVACYGDWPLSFHVEHRLSPGFRVDIHRAQSVTLVSENPRKVLAEFLAVERTKRIFYLGERVHVPPKMYPARVHRGIQKMFEEQGYTAVHAWRTWATELMIYELVEEQ